MNHYIIYMGYNQTKLYVLIEYIDPPLKKEYIAR